MIEFCFMTLALTGRLCFYQRFHQIYLIKKQLERQVKIQNFVG